MHGLFASETGAALAQLKRAIGERNPPLGQFVLPGSHTLVIINQRNASGVATVGYLKIHISSHGFQKTWVQARPRSCSISCSCVAPGALRHTSPHYLARSLPETSSPAALDPVASWGAGACTHSDTRPPDWALNFIATVWAAGRSLISFSGKQTSIFTTINPENGLRKSFWYSDLGLWPPDSINSSWRTMGGYS